MQVGTVIGSKYRITGVCSTAGGMGDLFHVQRVSDDATGLVLKICKHVDPSMRHRFSREVRVQKSFDGNSHITPIVDDGEHGGVPFYVMNHYQKGDLYKSVEVIREDAELQEAVFLAMCDCVNELHKKAKYHRDIKPENFLVTDEGDILISDFGLCCDLDSGSSFTTTSFWAGTHGYMPPEYYQGGFSSPTAEGDIFMLGKAFYKLLTGRDPTYITPDGVHAAILHVIKRCAEPEAKNRYGCIVDLKQDISFAYDAITGRSGGVGKAMQLITEFNAEMKSARNIQSTTFSSMIKEIIAIQDEDEREKAIDQMDAGAFAVLASMPVALVKDFFAMYRRVAERGNHTWSYAETIADNMKSFFDLSKAADLRALALEVAVISAINQNRYAAMDTCKKMVCSVTDDHLGHAVAALIAKHGGFLTSCEPAECKNRAIIDRIAQLKKKVIG